MKDENCIFCKLANGEIPSATLYEDEKFRVILDLGPATKGHCLILPKEHYANIFEIPEEVAASAMKVAKKLAPKLMETVGADGINILQNNGLAAGQTVFHFHIHLIPRFEGEEEMIAWTPGTLKEEDKELLLRSFAE